MTLKRIKKITGVNFTKFFFCVFFLPILLIVKIFVNFRLGYLDSTRLGHQISRGDYFLREYSNHPSYKFIIFTFNPANLCIHEMFTENMRIINSEILSYIIIATANILSRFKMYHDTTSVNVDFEYKSMTINKIDYSIPERSYSIGRDFLQKHMNGKKFICFHSRDNAYLSEKLKKRDSNYHNYRDFAFEGFFKSIQYLESRDFSSIRMGAIGNELDSVVPSSLINYCGMPHDDYLDIYFASQCEFFIGNNSGLFYLPSIFNTPLAVVNCIPYPFLYPRKNSLFTLKLLRDTRTKNFLSFKECQELGLFSMQNPSIFTSNFYSKNNLEPISNSEDELLDLTKDMLDLINNRKPPKEAMEYQEFYKSKFLGHLRGNKYAGNIAPSFIIKYQNLLR